jgi:hypothetical protein
VRQGLQETGVLEKESHTLRVLAPRSEMTGADRTWAARGLLDEQEKYDEAVAI